MYHITFTCVILIGMNSSESFCLRGDKNGLWNYCSNWSIWSYIKLHNALKINLIIYNVKYEILLISNFNISISIDFLSIVPSVCKLFHDLFNQSSVKVWVFSSFSLFKIMLWWTFSCGHVLHICHCISVNS